MAENAAIRRRTMQAVKSQNTGLEMTVRRLVHAMGYRYRLYRKDLPGKPDLTFPKRRKVIFVHGCFWHQHDCPRGARSPKSNRDYWLPKLRKNRERDARHQAELRDAGWDVLVLWECQMKDGEWLAATLRRFLGD